VRPICFTTDARGRLWVVEGHTYPVPAPEGQGRDRILILEDTNGDGTLDKRKVFAEGLNLVSGMEVGMGGVWLGAAPYLLFIPIDAKTDLPAGPPQKLLDGWGTQDTHETPQQPALGTRRLALRHPRGVYPVQRGQAGAPGRRTHQTQRGVWRYHPTRHSSNCSPKAPATPGGSTSTTTATPSSRPASSRTCTT
jgi:putative membrane-bound dehydrogenase-like protein